MACIQEIDNEGILTPRTRAMRQHFAKLVNDRCEQLENAHDRTNTRLDGVEAGQAESNLKLDAILARLEGLDRTPPPPPAASLHAAPGTTGASGHRRPASIATNVSSAAVDEEEADENNFADTEDGDLNFNNDRDHHLRHFNRQGMGREPPPREVCDRDDAFLRLNLLCLRLLVNMILMSISLGS